MSSEPSEWMRSGEVAELFGVTRKTITTWALEGRIPSKRKIRVGKYSIKMGQHRFLREKMLEIRRKADENQE